MMEQTKLPVAFGFKTDVGRVRTQNEDSYVVLRRSDLLDRMDALLVVADGMGGGRGGAVASRIVVETLSNIALEYLSEQREGRPIDIGQMMRSAIIRSNTNIRTRQFEQPDLRGMGTTCVAVGLRDGVLTIGNAGDSRVYLLREGQLSQLTDDHSEVWEQVKAGKMTREQARHSRHRNVITRAVGIHTDLDPDVERLTLANGDAVLLCSDGLTTEMSDTEIARTLASAPTPQTACDRLVDTALRNGGSDNVTVIVLHYGEFAPLMLAESVAAPEDAAREMVANEDDTDPNADWRTRTPQVIAQADEEDEEEPEYEEPRRRSRREGAAQDQGMGSLALTLVTLLICLVLAEAAALYFALSQRTVQVIAPSEKTSDLRTKEQIEEEERTAKDLIYDGPEPFYDKPLRDSPLSLDRQLKGALLVFRADGKPLRIDAKGKATELAGPNLAAQPAPAPNANPPILVAYDLNGNRYQTDPQTKSVLKFDMLGQRLKPILPGAIIAPTAMVVDTRGDLYLIANRKLLKVTSYESTRQIQADQQQKNQQRETP